MQIREFVEELGKLNFSLVVENDKLVLKGDRTKLSDADMKAIRNDEKVISFIRQNKKELMEYISVSNGNGTRQHGDVSAIYRLSALQEGLLFHGLYDGGTAYAEQLSCELEGVDLTAFNKAWQHILDRHTILRSSFHYDSFSIAVQCVYKKVNLPLEVVDFSSLDTEEQEQAIARYREDDQKRGVDFKQAPLMRISLLKRSEVRYSMLWTYHHLIFDGWSMPVLMQEFLQAYDILLKGEALPAFQEDRYEDYIRYIESRNKEKQEQFWREYLSKVEGPTFLPFVKDRSKAVSTYKEEVLELPADYTTALNAFARKHHLTVNTIMQGAWSYLLHRYTSNVNLVYGVTVSGRPEDLPGVEARVGIYTNTLALCSSITEEQKMSDWLSAAQQAQLEAREYQYTSLSQVQQLSAVGAELFDTMMTFQNYPVSEVVKEQRSQLKVKDIVVHEQTTNYPLSLRITIGNTIQVEFIYKENEINLSDVQRISGHFRQVLLQIIKEDVKVKDIELLTAPEKNKLLFEFNTTEPAYLQQHSILELFAKQAGNLPNQPAVVFGEQELTYKELDIRSNQLANYLFQRGVGNETLVAVCMDRSVEMIISILAVMKAGGAYVPIDPAYPKERIDFMLQDMNAAYVIGTANYEHLFIEQEKIKYFIAIDSDWQQIELCSSKKPESSITPQSLAYVIYTSGTTGKPKGVLIEHCGLVNMVLNHVSILGLRPGYRILQFASFSFDGSCQEIFNTLCSGGSLIMASKDEIMSAEKMGTLLKNRQVDIATLPPSYQHVIKDHIGELKMLYSAGEALNAEIGRYIQSKGIRLINGYGPTENTVTITLTGDPISETGTVNIGRPLKNVEVYIVDARGALVPQGVTGEIWVAGTQLARGYLKRAELTAEKFIHNPFKAGRVYKTGDLGRWLPNGTIAFMGRKDDQVKVRGYRVELAEVEAALQMATGVLQAVVVAAEDKTDANKLIGFIVPDSSYNKETVLACLENCLPDYMIPRVLIEVQEIPMTVNAKADKKRLLQLSSEQQQVTAAELPVGETEEKLAAIWIELLEVETVDRRDDFFALGGHSLLAIRLISSIKKEFGKELSIKEVFDHPTILALAQLLEGSNTDGNTTGITRFERNNYVPLSFFQEQLWFVDRLKGSSEYNMPYVYRLRGNLNVAALENAFCQIINRHEILRTVIVEEDGRSYQRIRPVDQWKWKYLDTSNITNQGQSLQAYIEEFCTTSFDLSKDDVLRVMLLKENDQEHFLVAVIHHIAFDGWSLMVMIEELAELYRSYTEQRKPQLKELPVQYADYAIWQRKYLPEDVMTSKLNYWKNQLKGLEPLKLLTDYPRPSEQSSRGAAVSYTINRETLQSLHEFCNKEGVTLFMALLAAFKVVLHRYTGQTDICVGCPIAGRQQKEIEGLIGFFVNTLVLRNEVEGEIGFKNFLQEVKRTTLDAYTHQEVPFEQVVKSLGLERDNSRHPLFDVKFQLQNVPEAEDLDLGGVQLSPEFTGELQALMDISLDIKELPQGLYLRITYCSDLYREDTIARMLEHYANVLQSVLLNRNAAVNKLQLLSASETDLVLNAFNDTAVDYAAGKTILDLFEENVLSTPDAIALVYEELNLTYSELDERANQLALYLRSKGVKEEVIVPVCVDRSLEMIVVMFGILKAGGAYLPIDPAYPQERIKYMLEDAGSSIVVTESNYSRLFEGICDNRTELVCIDNIDNVLSMLPANKIETTITIESLAYVIYTSGSTGLPKGVLVEHRGVVNLVRSQAKPLRLRPGICIFQFSSASFDASCYEIFNTLLHGGKLVLVNKDVLLDERAFRAVLDRHQVELITLPPSYQSVIKNEVMGLKTVVSAGEALNKKLAAQLQEKGVRVINAYGPTENTVCATLSEDPLHKLGTVTIGKPLENCQVYILDDQLNPMPIGVAGDMYLGGVQVARGYLHRDILTTERFIADPFLKEGKIYKTGDIARWLPDGNIEYLGRKDEQVKIHGYRIELGEIESTMTQLGEVMNACVVAKQDGMLLDKLVAYYVPAPESVKSHEKQLYLKQVNSWRELYESENTKIESSPVAKDEFDISGWNDSFTGNALPEDQMRLWLNDITNVILSENPQRVLEIGCGKGLIFFQLAGHIQKYIGADFSAASVNHIRQVVDKGTKDYGEVELHVCAAHEVLLHEEEVIDTVVLNSIVQYFPGDQYLTDLIAKCIVRLRWKGRIVIGDVRDLRLLKAFKSRLSLGKLQDGLSIKEFLWQVNQEMLKEEELCFSPEYFYGLKDIFPSITHVDVEWKQGDFINELSLYRYTVTLYIGIEKPQHQSAWQQWHLIENKQSIVGRLNAGDVVALKDVPNPRLWKERLLHTAIENRTANTVRELSTAMAQPVTELQEVNELLSTINEAGYEYRLLLNEDPLKMNVIIGKELRNVFVQQSYSEKRAGVITNTPLFKDIAALLQKDIREGLMKRLPEYMVPADFIALQQLPVTISGKADRNFLRLREDVQASSADYMAPTTTLEKQLAAIWQELLGVEKLGVNDNFFETGGHSLLVVRVIAAIRKEVGRELSIKDLFDHPTISQLAGLLAGETSEQLLPSIEKAARTERIPLSFAQERLWFIDKLQGSVQYHMPWVFKLEGKLDVDALQSAFRTILERHEVLRTVIGEQDGVGYQQIMPSPNWQLKLIDAQDVLKAHNNINDYIETLIATPFDLSADYMLKLWLVRLSEQEHVMVAVMHHIASDGWSVSIVIKELVALYRNSAAQLNELPVQYADYAIWQRDYLSGEVLESKLNYWKQQLQGVQPLELSLDHARPAAQSTRGGVAGKKISKALLNELLTLSHKEEATLFMTLLSSFSLLLHKYSGQYDICIGSPVAGRRQQEVEGLIGFFINTLALRTEINSTMSFRDLLQQVKNTTLTAFENQDVPFEKIVEALGVERDMGRSPVFQVTFNLQNTPELEELDLGGINLKSEVAGSITSKYDLGLDINEREDGLQVNLVYCKDLFNGDTVYRMLDHFETILRGLSHHMDTPLTELSILGQQEQQQLLYDFNNTATSYPKDKTVAELFEEQVKLSPDAVALVFEGQQFNYTELNERTNRLANYLKVRGVKQETLVPVCMNRSAVLIVSILGILKAGGAYVPVDPSYPASRISYMLEDIGSDFLLTAPDIELPEEALYSCERVDVDDALLNAQSSQKADINIAASSLAYVLYTSGSTGTPKGVQVEHRNIVSLVKGVSFVDLSPNEVILSTGSPSFDATTIEYWGALLNGGKLVMCAQQTLLDTVLLKALIHEQEVTTMWFTAGWFNELVETDSSLFASLKTILVGGDKLSPAHIAQIRESYPKLTIVNGYGPTENTTFSLTYSIKEVETGKDIPIGYPLSNRRAYILDEQHKLCPIGVIGEVCVGGDGLSRGYLNQEALTQQKFIADPFISGERLYKTGDLGRWNADGSVEYLGRKDEQVKIRGYRIELGEIENVLQQLQGIQQAVVIAVQDTQSSSKKLVGFVVTEEAFDAVFINEQLQSRLPEYMIPSVIMPLQSIPLTANGKVDRRKLQELEITAGNTAEYIAPGNETEAMLASIWQELLEIEQIGIYDNFFELGGHSLLAIRVIAAVRSSFRREVSIKDLFDNPTISELAAILATETTEEVLPTIKRIENREYIPLSFAQERLWFIDKLQGSVQYHMPYVFKLTGTLNANALEASFRQIIDRHSILRTVIKEEDGIGYQSTLPSAQWKMQYELQDNINSNYSSIQQFIRETVETPFDLSTDGMLRVALIHFSEQEHILIVVIHHIAFDGWSMGILTKELTEIYRSQIAQRPAKLAALPVQYADYAAWQRDYLSGEILQSKLNYWKTQLQGVAPLELPLDHPRAAEQSMHGAIAGKKIRKEIVNQLQSLSNEEGATLFMTLLTTFNVLLHRYSGQNDICIGSPIAGRQHTEVEGLIGFFINTLALRTQVNGSASFKELLQQVKQTTMGAYEHQDVPFERIVEALGVERDMSRTPVFQIVFMLQNMPDSGVVELGDVRFARQTAGAITSQFDISFEIIEDAGGLHINMTYCRDLFHKDTVERMLGHYEQLLSAAVANPNEAVGQLQMLSTGEEQQLLETFNDTNTIEADHKTIVDLFEEQVRKTPDVIAVIFEDKQISYKELDECSNQLANYLITKGVKEEVLVPVCMHRCSEMVISIMAILKAGGAYIPIDPAYPPSRINYMLKDTAAPIVVSQAAYSYLFNLRENGKTFVIIDKEKESIAAQPTTKPAHIARHSDLAYVIYTSGSTGNPKGVTIEHGALTASTLSRHAYYGATGTALLVPSFSFDSSVAVIFGTLTCGGSLIVCRDEQIKDAQYVTNLLKQTDMILCVPFYYRFLLDNGALKTSTLSKVILAGEKLDSALVARHFRELPGAALYNEYGPTEAAVWSSVTEIKPQDKLVTIGKPVSHATAYILDELKNLAPIGLPGELFVGGEGVARGYLKRADLTAEKFIEDPFVPGARIYRTGDVCRWLPNGNIEYVGRKDDQVKLRGYRIELGEIESTLQQTTGVKAAVVLVDEDHKGTRRLIAYAVPAKGFDKERIIGHLRIKLPEYMVPSLLISVDSIPLTPNGKVDKKRLQQLAGEAIGNKADHVSPRNELEQAIAGVWHELLGVEHISIHDNFFELGGDSIITIQIVSRLKRKGYELQPKDLFLHQTVARLAGAIVERGSLANVQGEQGLLYGMAGLLPIQQWYFENAPENISHYNQSVLFGIDKTVNADALQAVINTLVQQHDALRFSYHKTTVGWIQEYGNTEYILEAEDLSELKESSFKSEIKRLADQYQRSLDIEKGELLKAVLVQTPLSEIQNRLLIVVHHLAIDGVSWRILLQDMEQLLAQYESGMSLQLGVKSSSYRQWHQALLQYSNSKRLQSQKPYWNRIGEKNISLKADHNYDGAITQKDFSSSQAQLSKEYTQKLLQQVPKVYHTEVNDVLFTALTQTLAAFNKTDQIIVGLEGHGREDIGVAVDVNNTIGWFTSMYPVLLQLEGSTAGEQLKSIKEQLRSVPDKGMGYGVLKYINKELTLQSAANWEITFNYLGQTANVTNNSKWITLAKEGTGNSVAETMKQHNKMELMSIVEDGELKVRWSYSSRHYNKATIDNLSRLFIRNLEQLINHCMEQAAKGLVYTPSDFGLHKEVSYAELDAFMESSSGNKQIERVYKLSALQQGMLFHGLYDAVSGAYVEQFCADLSNVDLTAFNQTWLALMQKHTVLRTAFYHDAFSIPVQCVFNKLPLPITVVDHRSLPDVEKREAAFEFAIADRTRGFDFRQAPLMRITLLQMDEWRYRMVWTFHHILFDGWSMPVLVEEFLSGYEQLVQGQPLQLSDEDRFEDYIQYIEGCDKDKEEAYWKEYLQGLSKGSLLPFIGTKERNKGMGTYGEELVVLNKEVTKKLQAYAREHRLTINTIMQGVWSYLLYRYTGNAEVVYGVTVSGRPEDLPGVEKRVGMYINTLPLHTCLREDQIITHWLQSIQKAQLSSREYQHSSLTKIQEWTGIKGELFDTILVFENYPVAKLIAEKKWKLQVEHVQVQEDTNYPLCIGVGVGEEVFISFKYNADLLSNTDIKHIRNHFEHVLYSMMQKGDGEIGQLDVKIETAVAKTVQPQKEDLFNFETDLSLA